MQGKYSHIIIDYICLAYIVNDNMTIAGGYANFGNVFNHREENVWAIQVKYEF